jgi:hypothetical protein
VVTVNNAPVRHTPRPPSGPELVLLIVLVLTALIGMDTLLEVLQWMV